MLRLLVLKEFRALRILIFITAQCIAVWIKSQGFKTANYCGYRAMTLIDHRVLISRSWNTALWNPYWNKLSEICTKINFLQCVLKYKLPASPRIDGATKSTQCTDVHSDTNFKQVMLEYITIYKLILIYELDNWRTSRQSQHNSCFVLGRSQVQISSRRQTALTSSSWYSSVRPEATPTLPPHNTKFLTAAYYKNFEKYVRNLLGTSIFVGTIIRYPREIFI